MLKLIFLVPHLSTGGMPQYLLKQIELIKDSIDVYCIEWADVTGGKFIVQRERIKKLLGNKLITLGEEKNEIFSLIKKINPTIIHLQEIPEIFPLPNSVAIKLYDINRNYSIIETSHDSSFDVKNKIYFPDKFVMVSQYQINEYQKLDIPCELVEYPIEYFKKTKSKEEIQKELGFDPNLKHVINVGLFTPRKNQSEVIEYAKKLINYPIQFHFIGNQADNFKDYWEPIMMEFPSNCKWWDERSDVDNFYQAADLFLFTSRGTDRDKETMPLVIREAISWQVPSLIYNLPVYLNYFDKYQNITYLDFNEQSKNIQKIMNKLDLNKTTFFDVWYEKNTNKVFFKTPIIEENVIISVRELDSNSVVWSVNYNIIHANIDYWIIPTPKSYIDFESNPFFGGLKVEFYRNDNLIYSKEIRIKNTSIQKQILNIKNYTEPTYINYIEFFIDKIYDKYLLMKQLDVVVDVGANIGLWIEYINSISKPKKIYAIEPNKKALQVLKDSFLNSNVEIIDKALSSVDGQIEFFVDEINSTISSTTKYGSLNTSYKVDSISVKTFIDYYNIEKIDLLKVDIESGEYSLFNSLKKEDVNKIENILVEYHLIAGKTYNDVEILKEKLINLGFFIKVRDMHSTGGFIFASKTSLDEIIDNTKLKTFLDTNPALNKRELASLINKMFPEGKGVEIGVLKGDYSKIILERWSKGTLYLIDTWRHLDSYIDMNSQDDKYHYDCLIETCKNIKPWQDRAHIIRMDSVISADIFPDEYFDFIYIDADHSYEGVVRDIESWWPKIKKGGLFCGDDYIPDDGDIWLIDGDKKEYAGKFGVRKAVNEFISKKDLVLYQTTEEPYWRQWYVFKPF